MDWVIDAAKLLAGLALIYFMVLVGYAAGILDTHRNLSGLVVKRRSFAWTDQQARRKAQQELLAKMRRRF